MEILICYYTHLGLLNGFDKLVSQTFEGIIRKNLGEQTMRKIGDRLFEKYGVSVSKGIDNYEKMGSVLEEYFGKTGARNLERKFLQQIVDVQKEKKNSGQIRLLDATINSKILKALGDPDTKSILDSVNHKAKTIYQIQDETNLPQTSCYRKINQLAEEGLLVRDGFTRTSEGKIQSKYISVLKSLKINVEKRKVLVDAILQKQSEQSLLLKTIYN